MTSSGAVKNICAKCLITTDKGIVCPSDNFGPVFICQSCLVCHMAKLVDLETAARRLREDKNIEAWDSMLRALDNLEDA